MPEVSQDLILLLQYLVPGFLVAWICFGMTSYQKPSQFERVVQALIYALFVHFFVNGERVMAAWFGKWKSFGAWNPEGELFASLVTSIALGVLFSYLLNADSLHRVLRRLKLSNRSSHPSEWCTAFDTQKNWIVVHLKDDRRLYGWPHIWPSDPTKGHLFIIQGSWLREPSESVFGEESNVGEETHEMQILVDVTEVKWVEFIKNPEESNGNQTTIATVETVFAAV